MTAIAYDDTFDPPAPVLPLRLRLAGSLHGFDLAALIDTGSDLTVVPAGIAARHLVPVSRVRIRGASGACERVGLYHAEAEVVGTLHTLQVAGLGDQAIVGRDLLNRFVIELDGPARTLSIR